MATLLNTVINGNLSVTGTITGTAPNPPSDSNDNTIATTKFVHDALLNGAQVTTAARLGVYQKHETNVSLLPANPKLVVFAQGTSDSPTVAHLHYVSLTNAAETTSSYLTMSDGANMVYGLTQETALVGSYGIPLAEPNELFSALYTSDNIKYFNSKLSDVFRGGSAVLATECFGSNSSGARLKTYDFAHNDCCTDMNGLAAMRLDIMKNTSTIDGHATYDGFVTTLYWDRSGTNAYDIQVSIPNNTGNRWQWRSRNRTLSTTSWNSWKYLDETWNGYRLSVGSWAAESKVIYLLGG